MNNRGIFSSLLDNGAYHSAEKTWIVDLQKYHRYWYDLVVNPGEMSEHINTRQLIVDYLKDVKKAVEDNLEKRFVYFICSRTKVRFNTKKKPFFNPFTKNVTFHILIGKEKKAKKVFCKFFDLGLGKFCIPQIILTDKYVTFSDSKGNLTTASIHDFLESSDINLGISSNVEYVGYTENPHARPTNGAHTGLSDVLYKVSNDDSDTLIYFNLFKVTVYASQENSMINFVVPNAMTNEIDAELEGKVIEKCFIFYFNSAAQNRNKQQELPELKNNLLKMASQNKINSISFHYEFEKENDYSTFSSSKVRASSCHKFSVAIANGNVEISRDI